MVPSAAHRSAVRLAHRSPVARRGQVSKAAVVAQARPRGLRVGQREASAGNAGRRQRPAPIVTGAVV
jgi:hypothetical protein